MVEVKDPEAIKAPDTVNVVDGGAKTPEVFVVDTPEGREYIADLADKLKP